MPRQRQFEEDDLLEQAMIIFWQAGFNQTAIRDLATQTGVKAQSLYNTFGNKDALYLKALKHYVAMADSEIDDIMASESDVWTKMKQLLILNWPLATYPKGCMVINSISERHDQSAELMATYNTLFDHLTSAFERLLSQLPAISLTTSRQAQLASMLRTIHNGIQIDLANGRQSQAINETVNTTLAMIKAEG
ncbi:TetR/AcrR family transcriptional regulator [Furfurilactobacillus milii]|uniref:TetR family transcriptional regulator n=1 Tax=Furfurilactobacillus milii TaxID=2888272 RepID=A0A6N9I195_9LACO|nr:TetR/AcrR family transcriptional regulator [Furfurilactobacillus milii]MYV16163.1 TetR family transcriptional regulator [Furfurilactobacillus milii]